MTTYQPYDAAVAVERSLRQLLDYVFSKHLGNDWYERLSNTQIRGRADVARVAFEEVASREGREAVTASKLDFTRLDDLAVMARKEWPLIEPVLGPLADIRPLLDRAATYRNDVMHGRQLPTSAREILSGVAVELQNRIGTFMSEQDPTGAYFPRLTTASDSYGRIATSEQLASARTGMVHVTSRAKVVYLGESIELEATAVDPEKRDIEWTMAANLSSGFDWELESGTKRYERVRSGEPVRFIHTFTKVNASQGLSLIGRAVDARYYQHGEGGGDVVATFQYQVLPPRRDPRTDLPPGEVAP